MEEIDNVFKEKTELIFKTLIDHLDVDDTYLNNFTNAGIPPDLKIANNP